MSVPPNAPLGFKVKSVTATQIELVWKDTNDELSYKILRDGQIIKELQKDSTSFVDYDLKPATLYEYEIIAVNDAGETGSGTIDIKTKNPPVMIRLDRIGVADNGEESLREILDKNGEVFIGVVIGDGKTTVTRRLPSKGYYELADNSEIDQNLILFNTPEIGDYLYINIIGFESDGGIGEELLAKAFDVAVKSYTGGLSAIIMNLLGIDFTGIFKEVIGFDDDFLGEYTEQWDQSNNWGVGPSKYHECNEGDGTIGLKLWFTISSPIAQ